MISRKMIPFTPMPASADDMTWLELNVRAALLGLLVGVIFSPAIVFIYWLTH